MDFEFAADGGETRDTALWWQWIVGVNKRNGETIGYKCFHSEEDDDEVLDREVAETTSYQTEIFTCLDEIERALSNLHVQGSHRTRSSLSDIARSRLYSFQCYFF